MQLITRTFPCWKIEALYPLNSSSSFPPPLKPWQLLIHFLSLWIWLLERPHMHGIMYDLSLCDWLLSLTLLSSRFIHDRGPGMVSCLLQVGWYSSVCMCRVLFLHHPSLGVWAVPASHLQGIMLLWMWECKDLFEILLLILWKVGMLDDMVIIFLIFWGNATLILSVFWYTLPMFFLPHC